MTLRHLLLATAVTLSAGCGISDDTGPNADGMKTYRQQLGSALEPVSRGDNTAAMRALGEIVEHPLFDQLNIGEQRMALSTAIHAASEVGDYEESRDLALKLTEIDPGVTYEWYWLSIMELHLGNPEASAHYLTTFLIRCPTLLNLVRPTHVNSLVGAMELSSNERMEVLKALLDSGWSPQGSGVSTVWHAMALTLLERGDTAQIEAVISRIDEPLDLIKLRSDKRFDRWIVRDSEQFNVERAAEDHVDRLRAWSEDQPESTELASDLLGAMLVASMDDEVVALTDQISGPFAFPDDPREAQAGDKGWIGNARAIALLILGRTDEGLEAMRLASQFPEGGRQNVSQSLNFAQITCNFGHHEDAAAVLEDVSDVSGYGSMVVNHVRVCIATHTSDEALLGEAMDYLEKHRADAPTIYLDSLLQVERHDEAAAVLIAMLRSPSERSDALLWSQEFMDFPVPPYIARMKASWKALLEREDVIKELELVGRRQHYLIRELS